MAFKKTVWFDVAYSNKTARSGHRLQRPLVDADIHEIPKKKNRAMNEYLFICLYATSDDL
jgi:hypothetical protein